MTVLLHATEDERAAKQSVDEAKRFLATHLRT
jgi:hypothetical protein